MKVYKCYKRGKVKIKIDVEIIYNNLILIGSYMLF